MKKLILLTGVALAVCVHVGCERQTVDSDLSGEKEVDSRNAVVLHIYKVKHKDLEIPVLLKTPYGVMVLRDEEGTAHFILGNQSDRSRQDFTYYENFLEALRTLPKGSVVTLYDKCTVSHFTDFHPMEWEFEKKLQKDCKKAGMRIAKDPVITCNCELKG